MQLSEQSHIDPKVYWADALSSNQPDIRKPGNRDPEPVVALRRRKDGWTAERQGMFLNTLANTGSIAHAAEAAAITPRSAYRLRNHPQGAAFARAWDSALMTATNRLTAVAFERGITGTPRQMWRNDRIVAETSVPSDRMLMFLLRHLRPALFGDAADPRGRADAIGAIASGFPEAMAALVDTDVDADLLEVNNYLPEPPHEHSA
ncbi:hypothetical protein [Sphingomonas sp.]|jgi:hypothetical protein|uniref:hypothetical protein n=1 Tax=Sphingomonas sp. TaxID=28214 RepID=UPI002ED7BFDF